MRASTPLRCALVLLAVTAASVLASTSIDEFSDGPLSLSLNDLGQVSQSSSGSDIIGGIRNVVIELLSVEDSTGSFSTVVSPNLVNSNNKGALVIR